MMGKKGEKRERRMTLPNSLDQIQSTNEFSFFFISNYSSIIVRTSIIPSRIKRDVFEILFVRKIS